jgi:hypothetical protein
VEVRGPHSNTKDQARALDELREELPNLDTRQSAVGPRGATTAQLRPARRLLIFASVVTLALNVAEPLVAGDYGKAAFDAVGPLLLIG